MGVRIKKKTLVVSFSLVLLTSVIFLTDVFAQRDSGKVRGQTVFVGASHNTIDLGDNNENPIIVASRLIIRNTDLNNSISIVSVKFYGPYGYEEDGSELFEYLNEPQEIAPLASASFRDSPGITGAPYWPADDGRPCFIVKWQASTKVTPTSIRTAIVVLQKISGIDHWLFQATTLSSGIILEESVSGGR